MTRTNLRVIETPADRVDITALNRADIEKRDWSATHVAGDKGVELSLPDRPRRWWRG